MLLYFTSSILVVVSASTLNMWSSLRVIANREFLISTICHHAMCYCLVCSLCFRLCFNTFVSKLYFPKLVLFLSTNKFVEKCITMHNFGQGQFFFWKIFSRFNKFPFSITLSFNNFLQKQTMCKSTFLSPQWQKQGDSVECPRRVRIEIRIETFSIV